MYGMYLNNAVELFMSKTPFIILNYLFVMSYLFKTSQNKVYPLTKRQPSQNSQNSVSILLTSYC